MMRYCILHCFKSSRVPTGHYITVSSSSLLLLLFCLLNDYVTWVPAETRVHAYSKLLSPEHTFRR